MANIDKINVGGTSYQINDFGRHVILPVTATNIVSAGSIVVGSSPTSFLGVYWSITAKQFIARGNDNKWYAVWNEFNVDNVIYPESVNYTTDKLYYLVSDNIPKVIINGKMSSLITKMFASDSLDFGDSILIGNEVTIGSNITIGKGSTIGEAVAIENLTTSIPSSFRFYGISDITFMGNEDVVAIAVNTTTDNAKYINFSGQAEIGGEVIIGSNVNIAEGVVIMGTGDAGVMIKIGSRTATLAWD